MLAMMVLNMQRAISSCSTMNSAQLVDGNLVHRRYVLVLGLASWTGFRRQGQSIAAIVTMIRDAPMPSE